MPVTLCLIFLEQPRQFVEQKYKFRKFVMVSIMTPSVFKKRRNRGLPSKHQEIDISRPKFSKKSYFTISKKIPQIETKYLYCGNVAKSRLVT